MHFVLVSASPRRKKILENAGLKFDIETVEISEIIDKNLNIAEAMSQVATDKMVAFLNSDKVLKYKDFLAVSADTTVYIDGICLEKPSSKKEAAEFLRLLSGRVHWVYTGVCIYNSQTEGWKHHCEGTEVEFRDLTEDEILSYVDTGRPMDKAGAYGIQDEDHSFVKEVRGSINNVIGFPIEWFLANYK